MLSDFRPGDEFKQSVILRLHKLGVSAKGGVFAKGSVQDNSGKFNFVSFTGSVISMLKELANPSAAVIHGTMQMDRYAGDGALQIIIGQIELPDKDEDLTHLLPYTPKDIDAYKIALQELINGLTKPHLRGLLNNIFTGEVYNKFVKNPAAMRYHHAYLGGLLEHSVDVAKLARTMAREIGNLDIDMVVAGALLHDIGKIQEILPTLGFVYTDIGNFVGHIVLGAFMVEKAIAAIGDFPQQDAFELIHILLSHHGTYEKGSPVAGATKESFIVHYADELNAALYHFDELQPSQKSGWQYSKRLGRLIYSKA